MPGQRRRGPIVTRQVIGDAICDGASCVTRRTPCFVARALMRTLACALMLAAAAAGAQTPLHVRGTLVEFALWSRQAPLMLRATTRDGSAIAIEIAYNWEAFPLVPVDRDQFVDGSYVGVVAVASGDGTLRARAVLLYPEYLRGTLPGHHPWDSAPGSTMTNATLFRRDADGGAEIWMLREAQGERLIRVDRDVAFVTTGIGGHNYPIPDRASVFVNATRQRDGTITAARIFYGENGFVPPL